MNVPGEHDVAFAALPPRSSIDLGVIAVEETQQAKVSSVYVPDEHEAWKECTVLAQVGNSLRVRDANGNMLTVEAELCLSVPKYPQLGYPDMTEMGSLHEASVLINLRTRFLQRNIYTFISDILISVNPFERTNVYGDLVRSRYSKQRSSNNDSLPPHIFGFANDLYSSLIKTGKNQAAIISGESGAGKTEANKLIVEFLASRSKSISNVTDGVSITVHDRVLASSPILESFGNAKTIRNDNSSRFGKLLELQINPHQGIVGSTFESYLLEKSRVSAQSLNERNFHCFYYLLAGASPFEKEQWSLQGPEMYRYLSTSGCYSIPNEDSCRQYDIVKERLRQS